MWPAPSSATDDIVLRPLMATNGLLMFGCSTAFLFSVIQHIWFRS